jgi:hypothetical protein
MRAKKWPMVHRFTQPTTGLSPTHLDRMKVLFPHQEKHLPSSEETPVAHVFPTVGLSTQGPPPSLSLQNWLG